jgi:hypothetical protein
MNLDLGGLAFLIPAVVVIALSWFIRQGATIALMLTGMDRRKARFEVLSAFFGVGFTTRNSEEIISHPQRRKVISTVIILGNAGLITIIASLVGTVAKASVATVPVGLLVAVGVLLLLWRIAVWRGWMARFEKWFEHRLLQGKVFKKRKLLEMLEIEKGYVVGKVLARPGSEFLDRQLADLKLANKGLLVLAINRKGKIIRPPKAENYIREGDILTVFGKRKQIERTF